MKSLVFRVSILAAILLMGLQGCKKEESFKDIVSSGDLEKMNKEKISLEKQISDLQNSLHQLNDSIDILSPESNMARVSVQNIGGEEFIQYVEAQGNVTTLKNIMVYPETSGAIKGVNIQEGQYVGAGQLLARIDDAVMQQNIQEVRTNYELAKVTYEKQKRLWDQKIGSEMQYLQARTNMMALENRIGSMKEQISKTRVVAPFSGVIEKVLVKNGEFATPGAPMFQLVSLNNLYVEADVPESYLTKVKQGSDVEVEFPALNITVPAKIKTVSQTINPSNRSFTVRVPISSEGGLIKPNLIAKLKIVASDLENAVVVPKRMVETDGEGNSFVYVVENIGGKNIAKRRIITIDKEDNDSYQVATGLSIGDRMIVSKPRKLYDGQEVKIVQ